MSGERSRHFIQVADQAARRVVARLAMIEDYYGGITDPDVLTFQEIMDELDKMGHLAPDENCTSAVCMKAKRMVANAMTAVLGAQNA